MTQTEKAFKNLVVFGNTKLPTTTATFNMCAAHDCPSDRRRLCAVSRICYAKRTEKRFPVVLAHRRRSADFWAINNAQTIADLFLGLVDRKRNPVRALRFNVSGDVRSKWDIAKAQQIAHVLKSIGVVTYTYSARTDLGKRSAFQIAPDVIWNGSGQMLDNQFTPVDHVNPDEPHCAMDCRICVMCQRKMKKNIQVPKH